MDVKLSCGPALIVRVCVPAIFVRRRGYGQGGQITQCRRRRSNWNATQTGTREGFDMRWGRSTLILENSGQNDKAREMRLQNSRNARFKEATGTVRCTCVHCADETAVGGVCYNFPMFDVNNLCYMLYLCTRCCCALCLCMSLYIIWWWWWWWWHYSVESNLWLPRMTRYANPSPKADRLYSMQNSSWTRKTFIWK